MKDKGVTNLFKGITPNLMVEDVESTIGFYKEILNFIVIATVPSDEGGLQFAILEKDGFSIMIQERRNLIKEYPALETDKVYPSISLYIKVNNLGMLYDDLKAKHSIYSEIHTTFYGSKEFAILDNNGYVLTFTEYN